MARRLPNEVEPATSEEAGPEAEVASSSCMEVVEMAGAAVAGAAEAGPGTGTDAPSAAAAAALLRSLAASC